MGTYSLALVLLDASTPEEFPLFAKYTTALEISLAVGWAAFVGWGGTQLLMGLSGGIWIFKGVDVVTSLMLSYFQVDFDIHENNPYLISTRTLSLAFGLWVVHDGIYGGGKRFFGLLAPVLGSSMVVAAFSYTLLFVISKSRPLQKALDVELKGDVPSVWQFWMMMVHPLTSKAVGLFTLKGDNSEFADHSIQPDRIIALLLWFTLSVIGIRFQLKPASKPWPASIEKPLLEKDGKGTSPKDAV